MSDAPSTSDVHVDTVMGSAGARRQAKGASRTCPNCGRSFGGGYKKCPDCGMSVDNMDGDVSKAAAPHVFLGDTELNLDDLDLDDRDAVDKAMGFGKFPPNLPPSGSTRFQADPRLHSHPFKPDPTNPAKCADCGMGTKVHGRMMLRDPAPTASVGAEDGGDNTLTKTRWERFIEKAANLLIPTGLDMDDEIPDLDADTLTPVVKSAPKSRYSMAPVYMPGRYDAHGDFVATPDDLQKATWGYVESTASDRTVYLQHSDAPAGKWVEIMAWPYEVKATMVIPGRDGAVTKARRETTLPAGTVYMGVIWEPWAYDEIEKGGLRGFSLGGVARRVEAVLDDAVA